MRVAAEGGGELVSSCRGGGPAAFEATHGPTLSQPGSRPGALAQSQAPSSAGDPTILSFSLKWTWCGHWRRGRGQFRAADGQCQAVGGAALAAAAVSRHLWARHAQPSWLHRALLAALAVPSLAVSNQPKCVQLCTLAVHLRQLQMARV